MSWSTGVARSGAVALARSLAVALAVAVAFAIGATSLQAQVSTTELDPLGRALAAEDKGQMREAASA